MKFLPRRGSGTSTMLAMLMLAGMVATGPMLSAAGAQEAIPQDTTAQPQSPGAAAQPDRNDPAGETAASDGATPEITAPEAVAPEATVPETTAQTAPQSPPAATQPVQTAPAPEPTATQAAPETAQAAGNHPLAAPPSAETPAQQAAPEILPQSMRDVLAPMLAARDPNLPHDLSPLGMFMAADWVVKAVMIGLALASVVTWTVLVVKMLELAGASRRAQAGILRVERAPSLPAALAATGNRRDPVSRMVRAAAGEYDRSAPALDRAGDTGVKERIGSHLDRIQAVAGRHMGRGTGVLATIGSTAPFVGLFGTVWGIMNSFIGISEAQTTNLAVVAPGIAEALLATAIGLVAAIPAVVIYNVFARAITGYRLRLANAAAGVGRLASRDLDFRGATATLGE